MSELKHEIEESLLSRGVIVQEVKNTDELCSSIMKKYVTGKPSAWWLSLKHIKERVAFEDDSGFRHISNYIDCIDSEFNTKTEKVYFIADENDTDEYSMLAYLIDRKYIEIIIESCRYFEYYVVPLDISWLICETEHGEIIFCQQRVSHPNVQ